MATVSLTSVLQEFWAAIRAGESPLTLLQNTADTRLTRRPARSPHAVRREHNAHRLSAPYKARPCFVCSERATQEHHIVQIQHGGTNRAENKVWVCTPCHRQIHPQMAEPPATAPIGVVPHMPNTERQSQCPACLQPVISVQPAFRKTRYPLAQSKRPILLNPHSAAPYTTIDLHQPVCQAKGTLNRSVNADLGRLARRDVDKARGRCG